MHYIYDLVPFGFEGLEVVAINLDGQSPFDPAYRLLEIVGNRLRESPKNSGDFFQFVIHGGNQFLFILMKDWTPFFFGKQVYKKLRVKKSRCIRAVVRTANLVYDLRNLGKRTEYLPGLIGDAR